MNDVNNLSEQAPPQAIKRRTRIKRDFAFPHKIEGDESHRRAKVHCPGCGWGVIDPGWQYEDGSQTCRRCGYSSKIGRKKTLADSAKVLSPQEVALEFKVSRRTIYTWIICGWLRGHRIGGRWFVTTTDLSEFRKICKSKSSGKLMPQLWQAELAELWNTI